MTKGSYNPFASALKICSVNDTITSFYLEPQQIELLLKSVWRPRVTVPYTPPTPISPISCELWKHLQEQADQILKSPIIPKPRQTAYSDPWYETALLSLPLGPDINVHTAGGVLCAPSGYLFVCGGSQGTSWAYDCMDSWCLSGTCLLGQLVIPVSIHHKPETYLWVSSLQLFPRLPGDLLGGFPAGDEYFYFGYTLPPWWGHECVLRNLSHSYHHSPWNCARHGNFTKVSGLSHQSGVG